jgi:hypothetical protein
MLVNRRTLVIKFGRMDDTKALAQEYVRAKPAGMTRPVRCYVTELGAWNQFALEAEYESLAEYERLVAEWDANLPPEFWKKLNEVRTPGGGNEIWTLLE